MLNHSKITLDLSQGALEPKIKLFLAQLAESLPAQALEGLCNGYTFMHWRADIIGDEKTYLKRLTRLAQADNDDIIHMGKVLCAYKTRLEQIRKEKPDISFAERQREVMQSFLSETREALADAEDLYTFISSLIFTQEAEKVDNFCDHKHESSLNKGRLSQNDYLDLLSVVPPDKLLLTKDKESILASPFKLTYTFGFVLTKSELVYVLENVTRTGDKIRLSTSDHVVYLSIIKNQITFLKLADSNNKEPKFFPSFASMVDQFVADCFIAFNYDATYLPIEFNIFSEQIFQRPAPERIAAKILHARGKHTHIDATSWDQLTALHISAIAGSDTVVRLLLARNADHALANDEKCTAFDSACMYGHDDIVKTLAEHTGNIPSHAKKLAEKFKHKNVTLALEAIEAEQTTSFIMTLLRIVEERHYVLIDAQSIKLLSKIELQRLYKKLLLQKEQEHPQALDKVIATLMNQAGHLLSEQDKQLARKKRAELKQQIETMQKQKSSPIQHIKKYFCWASLSLFKFQPGETTTETPTRTCPRLLRFSWIK